MSDERNRDLRVEEEGLGSTCIKLPDNVQEDACISFRMIAQIYRDDILDPYVYPYCGSNLFNFILRDDKDRSSSVVSYKIISSK
ncbi:hypothetical protein CEXT_755411 [Caerostris extrusa]|uniref:Uncharacterized protein n=1 Tax=Caerostris extrusa TaxID=172846 RepID=A0AAV4PXS0_CAEEX|nr:hypothetical protein CEXT_755411 [Caerostris extrusa]